MCASSSQVVLRECYLGSQHQHGARIKVGAIFIEMLARESSGIRTSEREVRFDHARGKSTTFRLACARGRARRHPQLSRTQRAAVCLHRVQHPPRLELEVGQRRRLPWLQCVGTPEDILRLTDARVALQELRHPQVRLGGIFGGDGAAIRFFGRGSVAFLFFETSQSKPWHCGPRNSGSSLVQHGARGSDIGLAIFQLR